VSESESSGRPDVLVSVVVPIRNGRPFLARLVPALEAQTLGRDRFEVVVADDGSSDGGADGYDDGDWLRVSAAPPESDWVARNRGAHLARGDVLAFVDADCVPVPTWLEAGLGALEDADVVAGAVRFELPRRRTIWTLVDIETTKNQRRHVENGVAETANLFLRRDLFERVGGFATSTTMHSDFDFVARCVASGASLVFCEEALVYHPTRNSARAELRFIWRAHRSYAQREAERGARPNALKATYWLPVVADLRARWRQRGDRRSLVFDEPWLAANGVSPSLRERLAAAALFYVVLPYFAGIAQLVGYVGARRRLRTPVAPAAAR